MAIYAIILSVLQHADVVELVDTRALGARAVRREGSSPFIRTKSGQISEFRRVAPVFVVGPTLQLCIVGGIETDKIKAGHNFVSSGNFIHTFSFITFVLT